MLSVTSPTGQQRSINGNHDDDIGEYWSNYNVLCDFKQYLVNIVVNYPKSDKKEVLHSIINDPYKRIINVIKY